MEGTIKVLNQMVGDKVILDYAIGGAVGAIFYTEPTDTVDLDVMVAFSPDQLLISLEPLISYLNGKGYNEWLNEGLIIEGMPVQFLPTVSKLTVEAHEHACDVTLYGQPSRILSLEHLMAIMVEVARPKDWIRLQMCLDEANFDKKRFLDILERHDLRSKFNAFLSRTGQ